MVGITHSDYLQIRDMLQVYVCQDVANDIMSHTEYNLFDFFECDRVTKIKLSEVKEFCKLLLYSSEKYKPHTGEDIMFELSRQFEKGYIILPLINKNNYGDTTYILMADTNSFMNKAKYEKMVNILNYFGIECNFMTWKYPSSYDEPDKHKVPQNAINKINYIARGRILCITFSMVYTGQSDSIKKQLKLLHTHPWISKFFREFGSFNGDTNQNQSQNDMMVCPYCTTYRHKLTYYCNKLYCRVLDLFVI